MRLGWAGLRTVTRIRTLVVVLAGGAGGRLQLLTRTRAKPAVPFAGTHPLIDFPLSNAHNAGLSDVWGAQQYNPISLSDHLANGPPWDLHRTTRSLLGLPPRPRPAPPPPRAVHGPSTARPEPCWPCSRGSAPPIARASSAGPPTASGATLR